MSIWTSAELDSQISAWKTALLNLAKFQEAYDPSGRRLHYSDLPEVRLTLRYLEKEKKCLSNQLTPRRTQGRIKR